MKKKEIDKAANRLKILCGIGLIMIAIPIGVYIHNFRESNISLDPAIWGSFGDFFGGILNPIISLLNLGLLAFISYLIAKESSNDSNEMNLRLRRMDAYIELTYHLPSIERATSAIADFAEMLDVNVMIDKEGKFNRDFFSATHKSLESPIMQLSEYSLYLNKFPARYKHLFKYDFESEEYLLTKKAVSDASALVRRYSINLKKLGILANIGKGDEYIRAIGEDGELLKSMALDYGDKAAKFLTGLHQEL